MRNAADLDDQPEEPTTEGHQAQRGRREKVAPRRPAIHHLVRFQGVAVVHAVIVAVVVDPSPGGRTLAENGPEHGECLLDDADNYPDQQ
jgi:hypothetical protein